MFDGFGKFTKLANWKYLIVWRLLLIFYSGELLYWRFFLFQIWSSKTSFYFFKEKYQNCWITKICLEFDHPLKLLPVNCCISCSTSLRLLFKIFLTNCWTKNSVFSCSKYDATASPAPKTFRFWSNLSSSATRTDQTQIL